MAPARPHEDPRCDLLTRRTMHCCTDNATEVAKRSSARSTKQGMCDDASNPEMEDHGAAIHCGA
eukprot:9871477-Alexandrium_andersonii.AAC.1